MKKIEVTFERTQRTAETFEVPDSVYDEIKRTQRLPDDYQDRLEEILDNTAANTEYDYAVWSETECKQIIEWG